MATVCLWFARIWVGLVIAVVVLAALAHIASAPTLWTGISDVQGWFSPFNLWNVGLLLVLLAPAFGAYLLAARLKQK